MCAPHLEHIRRFVEGLGGFFSHFDGAVDVDATGWWSVVPFAADWNIYCKINKYIYFEKEYFLMSNLHWYLTNAALCPLVLLPFLNLKNIPINILITIHYFKHFYLVSS